MAHIRDQHPHARCGQQAQVLHRGEDDEDEDEDDDEYDDDGDDEAIVAWCRKLAEIHYADAELSNNAFFAKRRKVDEKAEKKKFKVDMEIIGRHMYEHFKHYAEIIEEHQEFTQRASAQQDQAEKSEDEKGEDEAKTS